MILTHAQRQAHWNWCREFIDREVIYRADDTHPEIPGKAGGTYVWQFYLRRATFNPNSPTHRLAVLGSVRSRLPQQPFQVCASEPSAPPIAAAIRPRHRPEDPAQRVPCPPREPKSFGFDNWFDGKVNICRC